MCNGAAHRPGRAHSDCCFAYPVKSCGAHLSESHLLVQTATSPLPKPLRAAYDAAHSAETLALAYLPEDELKRLGFRSVGRGVRISERAAIYNHDQIDLGDLCRVDDFCVLSGRVRLGRNVHLAVFTNVAGGTEGVTFEDFSGTAYGCHVFSQSDDYSGASLTNPTTPAAFKTETRAAVCIGRHAIIGTNSLILPGVTIGEGTAIGAMSMVTQSTEPWSIYMGSPARKFRERRRDCLTLEQEYLAAEARGEY